MLGHEKPEGLAPGWRWVTPRCTTRRPPGRGDTCPFFRGGGLILIEFHSRRAACAACPMRAAPVPHRCRAGPGTEPRRAARLPGLPNAVDYGYVTG